MIYVAFAALIFALVVVLAALSFVRWALRTIERKDRAIDQLRTDSLNRIAHIAARPFAPSPAEEAQARENAISSATRDLETVHVLADPEQAMEYPSPSEAIGRARDVLTRYPDAAGVVDLTPEEREPMLVDVGSVNGL